MRNNLILKNSVGSFIDSMFYFDSVQTPTRNIFNNDLVPAVDIEENEKSYIVSVDVPGIDKSDIKVEVNDGVLSISGTKTNTEKKENKLYSYYERKYGKFNRKFKLPDICDPDKISAGVNNGVLTLEIPKKIDDSIKHKVIKIE